MSFVEGIPRICVDVLRSVAPVLCCRSNTLNIAWTVFPPVANNLYFIFSPIYGNSMGNLYFMPAASWVLNNSLSVPVGVS